MRSPIRIAFALALLGACSDDKSTSHPVDAAQVDQNTSADAAADATAQDAADAGTQVDLDVDSGATDDTPDSGVASDCFENPVGNDQIINACTDAEKIDKQPTLPLLLADGGLPPLP